MMVALFLIPRLIYAISVHPSTFLASWLSFSMPKLGFSTIRQLVRLELRMENMVGVLGIGFALLSILLGGKGERRSFLIGLWIGFGVMCLFRSAISRTLLPALPACSPGCDLFHPSF